MNWLWFTLYYVKLLTDVSFGRHKTDHPITPRWRWLHWQKTRGHRMSKLY